MVCLFCNGDLINFFLMKSGTTHCNYKMNKIEVKNKLKILIRAMLLSDLEADQDIPEAITQEILKNYGCTKCTILQEPDAKEELDVFVKNFQKWIENTNFLIDESSVKKFEDLDFDLNVYEKYLEAETEYCEVTSELTKVLGEVLKHKETYSQFFKDECLAQDTNLEVLNKKCQFLKLQFFLKLYGEENALKGHVALRAKLKEELCSLKRKYNEVLEYNNHMSEIKNDKTFCELFRIYKELRRIEQMTEIIGTI